MKDLALDWNRSRVQSRLVPSSWVPNLLLGVTLTLVVFGLLSVYSASSVLAEQRGIPGSSIALNQLGRALVGLVALFIATFIDYRLYQRISWVILGLVVVLLLLLISPWTNEIAPERNGSRRWLMLGPITFQPSELAKIAVVMWTAAFAVRKQEMLQSFRDGMFPFLLVIGPVLFLIVSEPHLSATLITAALAILVLFAAGFPLRHFAVVAGAAIPLLGSALWLNSYQRARIITFWNVLFGNQDGNVVSGASYQVEQAEIAIGAGGIWGVGYGESVQKHFYLPEAQNDFIYPIIAEEWGFLGGIIVIGLFLLWTLLGFRIARSAPDLFGRLLAMGLTGIVAFGAFAHIGITMGVLPTTGVSLPFISAGGTGLVIVLGSTGILLNVGRVR